jgi:SAM-dependent methyltransferase
MITRVSGIYDEPGLYQLACAYRDIPAEVSALLNWCGKHSHGEPGRPRSVLELAAGPAEHALELARRGLRATALDRSPAMSAWAAGQARQAGLELEVVEADMRGFRLPGRFDLAITMLNSLCHLFTLDDMVAHLRAVAAHLDPGALYIAELAHPADYLTPAPRTSSEWKVEADGVRADVRWGGPADRIDPVSQITREHMTITVHAADGTVRTVSDVVPNRFWTHAELAAAIRLAGGFAVEASYGDFDDTTTLDDPAAWRMILILRRE